MSFQSFPRLGERKSTDLSFILHVILGLKVLKTCYNKSQVNVHVLWRFSGRVAGLLQTNLIRALPVITVKTTNSLFVFGNGDLRFRFLLAQLKRVRRKSFGYSSILFS